jgi:death-on-curing protein
MEIFLVVNGYEIQASLEEQMDAILRVASGEMKRDAFTEWLSRHIVNYSK